MLFHVKMIVRLPHDLPAETANTLKAAERAQAEALQKSGKWRHLWRIAGQYGNYSVFDVSGPPELHELLSSLPLFPFMEIEVTALCRHPSSVRDGDH